MRYNSLTKTERKIASMILSSPDLLSRCSLSEIAQQFDVAGNFIRFCRTLGFKDSPILNYNFLLN